MNPEQIYEQLTELAEKLGISVSEKNLKKVGIRVTSGLCKVRGESMFIMDKHATVREKVAFLADCLARMPLEDIYVVPAVREVIERHRPGEGELFPDPKSDKEGPL